MSSSYNDSMLYPIHSEEPPEVSIEEVLGDLLEPEEIALVSSRMQEWAFSLGAELVRRLALELTDSMYGLALARALGLGGEESVEEGAARLCISPQYLSRLQKEAEAILSETMQASSMETPKRESLSEGGWLDINDLAKALDMTRADARQLTETRETPFKRGRYGAYLYQVEEILNNDPINFGETNK